MSKKQYQLNQKAIALLDEKKQSGEPFTASELETLQLYAGAGGLSKAGASGRGLLYEYYTPIPVVEKMWGLAYKHGFSSGHILEPSVGIGRFLKYVDFTLNTVDAFEWAGKDKKTGVVNTISYDICRACFPKANITNDYFESIFYDGNRRVGTTKTYDLVIGNPPYDKFDGFYSGPKREGKHTKANTYDGYFLEKGIELLNDNGLLIFIIPSSFLDNDDAYSELKEHIHNMADLVDAYRMPKSIFDHTDIQTDIVVFKKLPIKD